MSTGDKKKPDSATSLGHQAAPQWRFDASVTRVFSDMLERSIPQYEIMRKAVFDLGCRFVQKGTTVLDLGCSKGDALAPFIDRFGQNCSYRGLELSEPMLAAARERFAPAIQSGYVHIDHHDLCGPLPECSASVTLCVLTLQFTPVDQRQQILRNIWRQTTPGGAVILVEKVKGANPVLDDLMVALYHNLKTEHGYGRDEVERKRLSLEGVLIPLSARENEGLLQQAGFSQQDCFWRWMNFAGWVALK